MRLSEPSSSVGRLTKCGSALLILLPFRYPGTAHAALDSDSLLRFYHGSHPLLSYRNHRAADSGHHIVVDDLMNKVQVQRWNGTFDQLGTIPAIRREIERAQAGGTVILDFRGAVISARNVTEIIRGFSLHRVIIVGHPTPPPHTLPKNLPAGDAATPRTSEGPTRGDTETDCHGNQT